MCKLLWPYAHSVLLTHIFVSASFSRLDLTLPTHHLGPRKLLKEGILTKAKSRRKLRVLLCSDILVLLDESGMGLYRVVSPHSFLCIRFVDQ